MNEGERAGGGEFGLLKVELAVVKGSTAKREIRESNGITG